MLLVKLIYMLATCSQLQVPFCHEKKNKQKSHFTAIKVVSLKNTPAGQRQF